MPKAYRKSSATMSWRWPSVSVYDLVCRCVYDLMCRSVFGES